MKKILYGVIKNKTSQILEKLGGNGNELVIDMCLSFGKINTIEYFNKTIIIHTFKNNEIDIPISFDDIEEDDKLFIYKNLKDCLAC